jgi:hypothetical protein
MPINNQQINKMTIEVIGLNVNEKQVEAIRQAIKARYTPQKVNQLNEKIRKENT